MSIEIENIRKSFGAGDVLKDINLKIAKGEMIALLGPSGSGKTTLLRILAGLESESSGRILFDGKDVTPVPAANRHVGFVFQNYALFRHMTVAQNVAFGLSVLPRSRRPSSEEIDQRVRNLLSMVQLSDKAQQYPSQLSGGQQQRVALARVLAIEPSVLLLDEPFGALDAQVREELRQWLRRLHHDLGFTGVFVTHDQEEAMQVADRVVVMHNGCIEQADAPDEIWEHPKTRFVLEFLSDVNVLSGRIEKGKLRVGKLELALDGPAQTDGPVDLLLRPKDAQMSRTEGAGLLPVVISQALPRGGAVQVLAQPQGWYEKPLTTIVLEDSLPKKDSMYFMSLARSYLYRGNERLPVHIQMQSPGYPLSFSMFI